MMILEVRPGREVISLGWNWEIGSLSASNASSLQAVIFTRERQDWSSEGVSSVTKGSHKGLTKARSRRPRRK